MMEREMVSDVNLMIVKLMMMEPIPISVSNGLYDSSNMR